VLVPGRRLIWATCPSTHTQPSLLIHCVIFWLTTRTGQGCSGVVAGVDVLVPGSLTALPALLARGSAYGWPESRGLLTTGSYDGRVTDISKRVLLAKPRGYCAGVDRAVQTVEEALKLYGPPIYVRKEIVHNRHVVATLQAQGAIFVEENEEVPAGSTVIFSAHGVAPEVHEQAKSRSLKAIDATCPLVTKVHQEARRFAAEDYDILLIGHDGHEEVIGTTGEAPAHIQLVDGPDSVDKVTVRDPSKVVWLSQTTLSVDETLETVDRLKRKLPLLMSPPSDDICYATSNRQEAVKHIAPSCDVVIVVGSTNSSNSQRLREVAVDAGARAAYLVDYAREIQDEWLDGASTVGLTSGASVPDELVMEVLDFLAARGFGEVDEVTTADEKLIFSLPQELRRDMKAAAAARAGEAAALAAGAAQA
jgi:4-hydroxy-3-methylbut-2-enyl diphosphate reductase